MVYTLVIFIFFPKVVHTREENNKAIMEGKNHLGCDVQAGTLSGQCVLIMSIFQILLRCSPSCSRQQTADWPWFLCPTLICFISELFHIF